MQHIHSMTSVTAAGMLMICEWGVIFDNKTQRYIVCTCQHIVEGIQFVPVF
jgi:hypothetical protein